MKKKFTYLMFDGRYYKIGITNNLQKRLKSIKTCNPDIILISYTQRNIEHYLHNKFIEFHHSGEWFRFDYMWDLMDLLFYFDNDKYIIYSDGEKDSWIRIDDDKTYEQVIKLENNTSLLTKNIQSTYIKKQNYKRGVDTFERIQSIKLELTKQNIIPTQKMIVERTGFSIATVKRNWNKEVVY